VAALTLGYLSISKPAERLFYSGLQIACCDLSQCEDSPVSGHAGSPDKLASGITAMEWTWFAWLVGTYVDSYSLQDAVAEGEEYGCRRVAALLTLILIAWPETGFVVRSALRPDTSGPLDSRGGCSHTGCGGSSLACGGSVGGVACASAEHPAGRRFFLLRSGSFCR
jgi:hypothetical protein